MEKRFTVKGHIFRIIETEGKEGIILSYYGKEHDFPQGYIWNCDNKAEVEDMIEAVIDPERYADDEYRERHKEELMKNIKW